jgi:chromatin segregation and condensation protein Rec8/ScpA/Scc1 (kleisin family)
MTTTRSITTGTPITPASPAIQEIDEFMVNIEDKIQNIHQRILQFGNDIIPLSKLTAGLRRLEAIRVFLLVLFLACRSKIQLWQEEGFDEIYLSVKRCGPDGEAGVKT